MKNRYEHTQDAVVDIKTRKKREEKQSRILDDRFRE